MMIRGGYGEGVLGSQGGGSPISIMHDTVLHTLIMYAVLINSLVDILDVLYYLGILTLIAGHWIVLSVKTPKS